MYRLRKILFVVFLLIAALCIAYTSYYFTAQANAVNVYEQLQSRVSEGLQQTAEKAKAPAKIDDTSGDLKKKDNKKKEETIEPQEPKQTEKKENTSAVDFDSLWSVNKDIIAWISIPDSNINYPVLQHPTEDNYYLEHTPEGYHARVPGSIYVFSDVSKDFSDFNTMIYGHNMYNGTMFSDLYMFQDADYTAKHPRIYIYTPEKTYVYRIFAASVYDDRLVSVTFDFNWFGDREDYIDTLNNSNPGTLFLDDVPVSTDSHIITLSTCIRYQSDKRLLIAAVREDPVSTTRQTGLLDN